MKTAVIIGASGLIGGHLLKDLLADPNYKKVYAWTRKPLKVNHEKLEQKVNELTALPRAEKIEAEDYFCCLGTTLKAAGSTSAFRKIDYDAVLEFGRLAERSGAERLFVISAIGADASSRVFYNRVKGEVERALSRLKVPTIIVFRPSLLVGKRKETRLIEDLVSKVLVKLPIFIGKIKKYAPIEGSVVAKAMQLQAKRKTARGYLTLESDQISECAKG